MYNELQDARRHAGLGLISPFTPYCQMLLQSIILSVFAGTLVLGSLLDSPDGRLALVGGTVYVSPDAEPFRDAIVLIEDGSIAAVGGGDSLQPPADVKTLDCSGCTIMAGFWNSHVHFFERKWAEAAAIPAGELERQLQEMFTRYGFTSVFDLSSRWENTSLLRERIESGEVPGPRIRSTGEGLVPPGAVPPDLVLAMMGMMPTPLPEVANETQAQAEASRLLDEGVDAIKLFMSPQRGEPLSEAVVSAAVAEAHRRGKPVFVHPNNATDVLVALRGGVDIIGHTTPSSGPWDEALLTMMKERDGALTPTLQLWKYQRRHDRLSAQEQIVGTAVDQLRAWVAMGGTVLFGTDVGAVEYDPGDEYVLMADAGMSAAQILASLTTAPAERFGESGRLGKIEAGFVADLVVLRGDPVADVRAFARVQYTLRDGRIIYRAEN